MGEKKIHIKTCLHLWCEAILIIRNEAATVDYTIRARKGHLIKDPLAAFGVRHRIILCDIVIAAKQFIRKPTDDSQSISDDLTAVDSQDVIPNRSLNYQRAFVLVGRNRKSVNLFPCKQNAKVQWNVTFGFMNKFMFLVEPRKHAGKYFILVVTAVIEPRALLSSSDSNETSEYFWKQIVKNSDWINDNVIKSMSSVCRLSLYDHIRLCGSAFDALNSRGYFQSSLMDVNYVATDRLRCVRRNIKDKTNFLSIKVLPCAINKIYRLPQFYVLANPEEKHSVFVLLPMINQETSPLTVSARIRKIGTLLDIHPPAP